MHNPSVSATTSIATGKSTVVFTTPPNYATRLSHILELKGYSPIWCPTITTDPTTATLSSLRLHLSPSSISLLSAVAFSSRTAITATLSAISGLHKPLLTPNPSHSNAFILAALGKDADLLDLSFIAQFDSTIDRVKLVVPPIATPRGLVDSLGSGHGRRILCPVPRVVGIEEPPVVPRFLDDLEAAGWETVRVDAYETRWLGPKCVEEMVRMMSTVDAVVFTSSGEVEGLLLSLRELGWDWDRVRRTCPRLVVAAHGPVTAAGAERLGVDIDVVSSKFESFQGVVDGLDLRLQDFQVKG